MKIKLDENLSRHLKAPLEQRGHDVTTVVEQRMMGKPDVEVGTAAKGEERMKFTLDLDFADLRKFSPGDHPGVTLFRPRSMGPLAVNQFALKFVKETDLTKLARCVAVVESHRVRVRRPPLDADIEWEEFPLKK